MIVKLFLSHYIYFIYRKKEVILLKEKIKPKFDWYLVAILVLSAFLYGWGDLGCW